MTKLSLIVSCYDRAGEFNRSIGTWLDKLTLPDEILIIDDDSHDGEQLLGCLDMFIQQNPQWRHIFRFVRRKKPEGKEWRNPCIPHNWAVKNCLGEMFVIIDPEVMFVNDSIGHTKRLLEVHKNAFISAGIHYETNYLRHNEIKSWDAYTIIHHPKMYGGFPQNISDWVVCKLMGSMSHAYLSGWKANWLAMGGKDERFTAWGWEDAEMHERMARCGYLHLTFDDIEIIHVAHNPVDMTQPWGWPVGNAEKLRNYDRNYFLYLESKRAQNRVANSGLPFGKMEIVFERRWT